MGGYRERGKSFQITQNEVLSAYKAVKANKGAGGVDRVDFEMFEKNWKNFGTECLPAHIFQNR